MKLLYKDESFNIIGAAMEVHNVLGPGFLESVYQEALALEFEKRKIPFIEHPKLEIKYKDVILSKYFEADFICYGKIIVEIKALHALQATDESQVINYLKATGHQLGILLNFGAPSLEHKRLVRYKNYR